MFNEYEAPRSNYQKICLFGKKKEERDKQIEHYERNTIITINDRIQHLYLEIN